MSILAQHLSEVKPSAVSVMSARAMELERQGRDIVRLTAGEPDFAPPDHIRMAVVEAVAHNRSKYPPVIGLTDLREAVCEKLARDNQLNYAPEQVIVSSGCKQVLFNAMAATLDPGDKVLLPMPYWMSYPAMVRLNRGTPVLVPSLPEDGFKLQPETLEQAITPQTKWLFINSPNNPSGAVYSKAELSRLAEVLIRHPHVWILSDDIYEFLAYGKNKFVSLLNVAPELADRTLVVNGFSKTFCVPGWRVGYGAGPVALIKAMFKIQTQSTSGANILAQYAGLAALRGDQGFLREHLDSYDQRRDLMVSRINQMEGLSCQSPEGAFYCLVSNADLIGRKTPSGLPISTDDDWVNYLLDEGVAVVPGEPFGLTSFFRISFAAGEEQLKKGCDRINQAIQHLT